MRACRMWNEAVRIPDDYGNTEEAYMRYDLTCSFSAVITRMILDGLSKKIFLERHDGAGIFSI